MDLNSMCVLAEQSLPVQLLSYFSSCKICLEDSKRYASGYTEFSMDTKAADLEYARCPCWNVLDPLC